MICDIRHDAPTKSEANILTPKKNRLFDGDENHPMGIPIRNKKSQKKTNPSHQQMGDGHPILNGKIVMMGI